MPLTDTIRPQIKVKPFRSKAKLAFVRTQDCYDCDWPAELKNIEAHHIFTNALSSKCGDDLTVPLCGPNARGCHLKADKSQETGSGYLEKANEIHQLWLSQNKLQGVTP